MEKRRRKEEALLMKAIGFTPSDLEANRSGQLSERQRAYWIDERRYWRNVLTVAILLSLGLLVLLAIFASADPNQQTLLLIGILALLVGIGGVIYAFNRRRQYSLELTGAPVNRVEGPVYFDNGRKHISIKGYRWAVSRVVAQAFGDGNAYVIYFTPRTRLIVSAEWPELDPHPD